eukprot:2363074-Heterocapsa_arctica.AAC.1
MHAGRGGPDPYHPGASPQHQLERSTPHGPTGHPSRQPALPTRAKDCHATKYPRHGGMAPGWTPL